MNIDIYKQSYVKEIEAEYGEEYARLFRAILEQDNKYEKDGICYVSISIDELSNQLPYTRSRIQAMFKRMKMFDLIRKEDKTIGESSLYSIAPKGKECLIQDFVNRNFYKRN